MAASRSSRSVAPAPRAQAQPVYVANPALPAGAPSNADLAELLAREAEKAEGHRERAYTAAAGAAFHWPEEAAALLAAGRSLTELAKVGPFLERQLKDWIEQAGDLPEPPPLRAEFLTLTECRRILFKAPGWRKKLRGDLQMHTTWSDGSGTVHEMGNEAARRGYQFIAVTDHSKGLKIAGGIDEAALLRQRKEIDQANEALTAKGASCRIFHSLEMNLDPAGRGDMEPAALGELDFVLGSFHSALRRTEDQTARYLAALENPDVQILGHPRGRVYNYRAGLTADWARVFARARELDKAVEIDGFPDRQDLSLSLLKLARAADVRISLGTDAHHPWQMDFMEFALAGARRAGIRAERIINFMEHDALTGWVAGVRGSAWKKK